MVFDHYSDDGDITYKHYTGNDSIDIECEDGDWYDVSTKTINEMLQENDLREKMVQATLQLLNKNKVLENFNIEELAGYDEKLNKKFRDFIKLNESMKYSSKVNINKKCAFEEKYKIIERTLIEKIEKIRKG